MSRHFCTALAATVVMTSIGCFSFERSSSPTGPSATGISALLGVWTSANIIPSPTNCTDFVWEVTDQTANTAAGNFTATCAGGLKLAGRASGALSGSDVVWIATGNATAQDLPSCAISLNGTAKLEPDQIRVPYTGTTCLGPVSGTEILKKK